MENNTPVQFVSLNPVDEISTVFGEVTAGQTYYVIGSSITDTQFQVSETKNGPPLELFTNLGDMYVYGGEALHDMFYVRNGTGIRNMTVKGLRGTLTAENEYLTRRPTGGAYVALDPGEGPAVGVDHRQGPHIAVGRGQVPVGPGAHDVDVGVAVGDHHALGWACGAGCVHERKQIGAGEDADLAGTGKQLGQLEGLIRSCQKVETSFVEQHHRQAGIAQGGYALDLVRARFEIGCRLARLRACCGSGQISE